jgi:SagB-type dehydrogenase family enzyme
MEDIKRHRHFLKGDEWIEWKALKTDQKKGVPAPPPQKPYPDDAILIDLKAPEEFSGGKIPLIKAIKQRRSHRKFTPAALTLSEFSFILWATQGMSKSSTRDENRVLRTFRTVPSGGARHPFETYIAVNRVEGLDPGLYRYLPLEHKVYILYADAEITKKVNDAYLGIHIWDSAVVFIWTAIPYRSEWRYGIVSHKMIGQESGHICQNLYLASEAIGAGTCAIGTYHQAKLDEILGVDGEDEFAIYLAPVGKIK